MRRFMYGAVGALALALAFQIGSESARAQSPERRFVSLVRATDGTLAFFALTENGEVWRGTDETCPTSWTLCSTVGGGAVPVKPSTWGRIKSEYR